MLGKVEKIKKRILIIDRDLSVCKEIKNSLQNNTCEVFYTQSAAEGFELFAKQNFCLAIVDINLLDAESPHLLLEMRRANPIPILVLLSTPSSSSKIDVLRAGAHGCLNKPIDVEECFVHAHALMELYTDIHPTEHRCYTLAFGMDLIIDPVRHQATLKGEPLNLTRKEFDLLFTLASHAGQVLSREQLYSAVWNEQSGYNIDESVKAHIKALRKKLTPSGKEYIKNEWGIGYRFSPEDDEQS